MIALVLAHALAALVAPTLIRQLGARGFVVLAAVPAWSAGWAAVRTATVTGGDLPLEVHRWVDKLGLELAFRMDTLAWLMTLVVTGIGALVLLYCAHYFDGDDREDVGRFAGYLVGFAGAMLGLVTTDDLLTLYIFWELTTVLSYLLIGYHITSESSRGAAKQALVVTTAGGLAMLVGIVMIGQSQGTYRISEVLASPGSGPVITTGVVLLLVGAITKSALIPFHFWLPGAMAAPTPVSAYLHAAAMVKAGIYLVGRFAPAYAELEVWKVTVVVLGGGTMLIGAWRAMRQYDLKLLLAFGTVSQLGFLTVLMGLGTTATALAGTALLLAHALFKSSLFLTVGAIDHATGTRDLRRLHGLARRMPWLLAGAVAAALSMAGLPPMIGFAGKEAAYESLLPGEAWASVEGVAAVAVILGSILTFAYSSRFLYGAFGPATATEDPIDLRRLHQPGTLLVAVPVVLGLTGLVLGLLSPLLEPVLAPYADTLRPSGVEVELGLWHGFNVALGMSVLTWVVGALLFWARHPVARFQASIPEVPSAAHVYQLTMRGVDRLALETTGAFQRGSLPALLSIILGVLVVLPGIQLLRGVTWPEELRWYDTPAQPAIALLVLFAALATTRARRRLRAVFLVSVTGYGCAMLFLLHGAPDLALTQVLVETVTLVVFVLVLRRLSGKFPDDPSVLNRRLRAVLGAAVGLVVAGIALTASAVRNRGPAGEGLVERAVDYGGGNNIVNVILVDVRAWDTMGELSVVLVAATGVASLVFLREEALLRVRRQLRASWRRRSQTVRAAATRRWLSSVEELDPRRRSTIFEVVTRLVFHTIVLWSAYLLFSGHNNPGGGFAAGLVAGLALTLRYLAGRGYELRVAAPVMPGLLLGSGLAIAVSSAVLPMFFGYEALRTFIVDLSLPVFGEVHLVTSLLFDVGVYLVVIGLMLDILRSLGSELDDQIAEEQEQVT
jgi:multicomponent Na+:H+ antiporter subunit A